MEQSGSTNLQQNNNPKTKQIFLALILLLAIGILGWLLVSNEENLNDDKSNNTVKNSEQVENNTENIQVEIEEPEFCNTHPEYCVDNTLLENTEAVDPISSATGLPRSKYCISENCEGDYEPFIEVEQVELSPEIVLKIKDKETSPYLEFTNKNGDPSDIPPLEGMY